MKYIYLLIFFLSASSSNNALAFWNKVSDAQKEDCLNKAEGYGATTFTSKKRYQQCIKAIKEKNKQKKNTERLVKKYYDDCFPDLFEDFKSKAEKIIYSNSRQYINKRVEIGEYNYSYDSEGRINLFLKKINLNPEDNEYFKFSEYQSNLLFDKERYFGAYYGSPKEDNKIELNNLRSDFRNKLNICAENKSKPFFKF